MTQLTVEQLKSRIEKGEQIHLLDVREDHERAEFNIGGLHHRLGLIQTMQTDPLDNWKEEEIVIYCRSGNRSGQAALILETMGYKNVVNVVGGMLDWQAKFGNSL